MNRNNVQRSTFNAQRPKLGIGSWTLNVIEQVHRPKARMHFVEAAHQP
jgi:hypothetical protein